MPKPHVAALCFALSPSSGDSAPSAITYLPSPGADGFIRGIDGRAWRLSDPGRVAASLTRKRAISENHAGRLAAPKGLPSPAFAWITAARADAGGVVVDVTWTTRGKAAYLGGDYGYFSPEFLYDPATSEITAIVGGSLTNDPNLPQLALNSEHTQEQSPMSLKAIALALNLAETADEAACLAAITTLKSEKQTALNAAAHPDPQAFAPRAELQTALNRATTAEGELQKLKGDARETEINTAVQEALDAGKIIPATKDFYVGMCRAEGGLEKFKAFVAVQPQIAKPTTTAGKPGAPAGADGLSAEQLAVCSATGITPEQFKAAQAA